MANNSKLTTMKDILPSTCATSQNHTEFVGLDIGKSTLVCAITTNNSDAAKNAFKCTNKRTNKRTKNVVHDTTAPVEFANNLDGITALVAHCKALPDPFLVCESGSYATKVLAALHNAKIPLAIVPGSRVRHFAKGRAVHIKNDAVDARLLAQFAAANTLHQTLPPPPENTTLRDLEQTRRFIVDRLAQLDAHLENAAGETRRQLLREQRFQQNALAKIERKLAAHIEAHPALGEAERRMRTVKCVGPATARALLAYAPEAPNISPKRLVSLCGLAPYEHTSGTTKRCPHIFGGRKNIRNTLYMSACCAIVHNPILRAFHARLIQKGKPKRVALTAVMRKLLHLLHRILTDPNFTPKPTPKPNQATHPQTHP
jgi:transposase